MSYQWNESSSQNEQISAEADDNVENDIGNGDRDTSVGEDVEMKASLSGDDTVAENAEMNGDDRDAEIPASANSDGNNVEMHALKNSDAK